MIFQQVSIMVSDNSIEAYKKAYKRIDTLRYKVYATIADNPGLMDEQIAKELRTPINSITGRVKELKDAGLIVCTDTVNHRGNVARRSYLKGST